jgi:quinol-cytochrome oxidoreductase complex cytochrome b subunit
MEEQIKNLETKIDAIQADVKKMKSYFLWTFWVTIALFVLPIIGLIFTVPKFLGSYGNIDLPQENSINEINSLLNNL